MMIKAATSLLDFSWLLLFHSRSILSSWASPPDYIILHIIAESISFLRSFHNLLVVQAFKAENIGFTLLPYIHIFHV